MLISYNWLKEFVDFDFTAKELEEILTMLGIEVESITDFKNKYNNIIVSEVTEVTKHPKADKLSICKVNTGGDIIELICGAPNVAEGQKVFLGMPGAVVPQNSMLIERRKIRDVVSNGMIFSSFELGLDDDHSGIMVLPEDAKLGTSFVDYMGKNDIIFEISVTPNRADCLSHIGIAREIAAYNRTKVKYPASPLIEEGNLIQDNFQVLIKDIDKCPRYTARIVRNIKNLESPQWLKIKVQLLGLRSINAIVDVTNYVLYECGQPLHAFDLDRLEGSKIVVQTAGNGEKFITLDSKERILDDQMLMICDAKKSIAIGGVMGGENTEINDNTKNILIESAYFNPSSIRRTSKKLGISSDASYRFERGVDIEGVVNALNRSAYLIAEITGGIIDKGYIDIYPKKIDKITIPLKYRRACEIIGIELDKSKIIELLEALEFRTIETNDERGIFEVPTYKVDIKGEIDLIEEIARLYNYDNIEPQYVSELDFNIQDVHSTLAVPKLRNKIRDYLIPLGFNEILTQNQIDPKLVKIFDSDTIELTNPLGEELSVMRPSLIPSMLKTINHNIRFGNNNLRLFEIGRAFKKVQPEEETFVEGIKETEYLVVSLLGAKSPQFWKNELSEYDFFDIKGLCENLLQFIKISSIEFAPPESEDSTFSLNSMRIFHKDKLIGAFGELSSELLKAYEIEGTVFCLLLELSSVYKLPVKKSSYRKIAPYPAVQRDLAFVVSSDIKSSDISNQIEASAGSLLNSIEIFDFYEGKNIGEGKVSIAFSLKFSAEDRTLTDNEVDEAISRIVANVESRFNAVLRKF